MRAVARLSFTAARTSSDLTAQNIRRSFHQRHAAALEVSANRWMRCLCTPSGAGSSAKLHQRLPDRACTKLIKCWSCGHLRDAHPPSVLDTFFCEKCKVVQAPNPDYTYFDYFDSSPEYDISDTALTKKYRQMQTYLHPDKFGRLSQAEQRESERQSAMVNKAFETLRDPLLRGLYLLKLHGQNIEEAESSRDAVFLMEIMDVNERLDEASSEEDVGDIGLENAAKLDKSRQVVSDCFARHDIEA